MEKTLFDADAVARMTARIAHEIVERNDDIDNIVLVGIVRRGVTIAETIAEKIRVITGRNVDVGTLDITLYRDDLVELEPFPRVKKVDIGHNIVGRTVIIVDDVIYTGRTARAAIDAIFDVGRPKCIQLVVLVDRGHRELPIRPDFVGKNVPTSQKEIIRVCVPEFDGISAICIRTENE